MQQAGDAFDGVQFHCYAGSVSNQDSFHTQFPQKQIYFTECSGVYGSDWWSDIKVTILSLSLARLLLILRCSGTWIICRLHLSIQGEGYPGLIYSSFIGSIEHNSHSGMMWNIALDGQGNPKLPGTTSCGGPGCRPIVTVDSNGTYTLHQEYYSMAQASRGILPRDVGGPFGKRIGVSVGGELNWALRVGAYVTGRVNSSDWLRYSLVVLNW